LILCHCGTRFGPPQGLRIGDVLNVAGRSWALIRTQAGYDGAAHEFRPHSGPPKPPLPRGRQQKQRLNAAALMAEVMSSVDAALAVPEFMLSTPAELRSAWALIDTAEAKCQQLKGALAGEVRSNPSLRDHFDLLSNAMRQVDYQQRDALTFRKHYLGEINL
jgi:hypothetical protein